MKALDQKFAVYTNNNNALKRLSLVPSFKVFNFIHIPSLRIYLVSFYLHFTSSKLLSTLFFFCLLEMTAESDFNPQHGKDLLRLKKDEFTGSSKLLHPSVGSSHRFSNFVRWHHRPLRLHCWLLMPQLNLITCNEDWIKIKSSRSITRAKFLGKVLSLFIQYRVVVKVKYGNVKKASLETIFGKFRIILQETV